MSIEKKGGFCTDESLIGRAFYREEPEKEQGYATSGRFYTDEDVREWRI